MAAEEQQGERIVVLFGQFAVGWHVQGRETFLAMPPSALATPFVHQPTRRDGLQPRSRIVRDALLRPLQCRCQERLLDGILARVELAMSPRQGTEDLRRELAQQVPSAE